MRLTRRALLVGGGASAAAALATHALAQRSPPLTEVTPVGIRAVPIESFLASDRARRRFGALTFRSGLELRSDQADFGGFSGLSRSANGRDLLAITDRANWLTATVTYRDGQLSGLADPVMAPMLGAGGQPLRRSRSYDAESLVLVGGRAYVGIERSHEVMRFDWARHGVKARGRTVPVPRAAKDLPSNRGLEAIGAAPARSALAGALVAIAERSGGEGAPTAGFVLSGPRAGAFTVARSNDYDVTDLAFLGEGTMLLLERHFSLWRGPAVRLRRIAVEAIRPGAELDGPVLFEADIAAEIDNMEGLALHQEGGRTILTLISDNNFSALQRTLLLEFVLEDD